MTKSGYTGEDIGEYVSGPGGLWILDANGKHLGTLRGPEHPHNMAWGDADKRTLYLAALNEDPGYRCWRHACKGARHRWGQIPFAVSQRLRSAA